MGFWCPPSVRLGIWLSRSFPLRKRSVCDCSSLLLRGLSHVALCCGIRVFAMITANMTIDVKEPEHVAMFSDAPLRALLTECLAALACRQLGQLAAQGLDFRHAVQPHNAAQFPGGIFLQRLRAWDAEKS